MFDCDSSTPSFADMVKKYSSPVDSQRVEIAHAAGNKLKELNAAIKGCECELDTYRANQEKLVSLISDVETTNTEASLVALGQHLGLVKPIEGCD